MDAYSERSIDSLTKPLVSLGPTGLTGRSLSFGNADSTGSVSRNYTVFEDGSCLYFGKVSRFKAGRPDIELHHDGVEGTVAAVSRFRWNFYSPSFGLGVDEKSMVWVKARHKRHCNKTLRFTWMGVGYVTRPLTKTERDAMGAKKGWMKHLTVLKEASGEMIALNLRETGAFNCNKKSSLSFAQGMEPDLEVLVVLAIATWYEILRRE